MSSSKKTQGRAELAAVLKRSRHLFLIIVLFSFFSNLLLLTGPIYMMQVYDRVLGSKSVQTLVLLTVLAAFMYICMGCLDYANRKLTARIGVRFHSKLEPRVFDAVITRCAEFKDTKATESGLKNLEHIHRFFVSPALLAMIELPWTAVFLICMFFFHPALGILAISGGITLGAATILTQVLTSEPQSAARIASRKSEMLSQELRAEPDMIKSMGMRSALFMRWSRAQDYALQKSLYAGDTGAMFAVFSKTFRMFLQSASLGLGAFLVIRGEISPGMIMANSILLGRTLQPIDALMVQWSTIERARQAWEDLVELLSATPLPHAYVKLPTPRALIDLKDVTLIPPGQQHATLRMVSMTIEPGMVVGIIGPSGSGKSSIVRTIAGIWKPIRGQVRLDGAALHNYDTDVLGSYIGYMPVQPHFMDGTVAENIARMALSVDHEKVVDAAIKADAHRMILQLSAGYETPIRSIRGRLSAAQMQRISLARAFYGDPVFLLLHEPFANLDSTGANALNIAIRRMQAAGKSVLITANQPSAIRECSHLLFLKDGIKRAFGPRDQVLEEMNITTLEPLPNTKPDQTSEKTTT